MHSREDGRLLLGCTFDNYKDCNPDCYNCYNCYHHSWWDGGSVDEVGVASNVPLRASGSVIHLGCHWAGEVCLSNGAVADDPELVCSWFTNVDECLTLVEREGHSL